MNEKDLFCPTKWRNGKKRTLLPKDVVSKIEWHSVGILLFNSPFFRFFCFSFWIFTLFASLKCCIHHRLLRFLRIEMTFWFHWHWINAEFGWLVLDVANSALENVRKQSFSSIFSTFSYFLLPLSHFLLLGWNFSSRIATIVTRILRKT